LKGLNFSQLCGETMTADFVEGNFLGLPEESTDAEVVILSLPYELTTSYGQGTKDGPIACIKASGQVELYDPSLPEDLPAGVAIHTAEAWDEQGNTLLEQLDSMTAYLKPWFSGDCFPLVLGGEHGILPAIMAAQHTPLNELTLVQIDAHADLREELDGEKWSHACAAARSLDLGVGKLLQLGIRAYSREEAEKIAKDERINTWFASDVMSPCAGQVAWQDWLKALSDIQGPVHLSIDIDGMDGSLVPDTGTPVPGGLSMWHAVETIEALFSNTKAQVLSADVNEIVPGKDSPLTEFTAAMLATKVLAGHISTRLDGRFTAKASGKVREIGTSDFFARFDLQ